MNHRRKAVFYRNAASMMKGMAIYSFFFGISFFGSKDITPIIAIYLAGLFAEVSSIIFRNISNYHKRELKRERAQKRICEKRKEESLTQETLPKESDMMKEESCKSKTLLIFLFSPISIILRLYYQL